MKPNQICRRSVSILLILTLMISVFGLLFSVPAMAESELVKAGKVKISGSKYVAAGKKITLKADQSVKWSSSNKKIATVSSKGVVKGIKAGKVTITAKASGGAKATWKMTVTEKAVKSVKISPSKKELDLNGTKKAKLKAEASPSGAAQSFTWKSSDTGIATVSSSGEVKALSVGTVKITATATDGSGKKGTATIVVKNSESTPTDAPSGKIGVSMPSSEYQRWATDGSNLEAKLKAAGYQVNLQYAQNDVPTQISQIEAMISNGCNVLIVSAIEGSSLNTVLDIARNNGIYVIAYDRLLWDTTAVSYYVSFNNTLVGKLQGEYIKKALNLSSATGPFTLEITAGDPGDENARKFYDGAMDVLKPYIDSGKLVVRSGQTSFEQVATPTWRSDVAQKRAEDILTANYAFGEKLDVWLCSNDSTALGVIEALKAYYSGAGWPIITGQDCDIANVKKILAGKQAMSVFKDTRILVDRTVKMVNQILNGQTVEVNGSITTGSETPAYLCKAVVVDKNNYREYLIESGYYTEDQLR